MSARLGDAEACRTSRPRVGAKNRRDASRFARRGPEGRPDPADRAAQVGIGEFRVHVGHRNRVTTRRRPGFHVFMTLLLACTEEKHSVPDQEVDTACAALNWYVDADGDGQGGSTTTTACSEPEGAVATGGDCDDTDPAIFKGAVEVCGGGDEDCDGDENEPGAKGESAGYLDADGDGYGDPASGRTDCPEAGLVLDASDCDDTNADAHPGGTEVLDDAGVDEDCDGFVASEEVCGDGIDNDLDGDATECVFAANYDASTRAVQFTGAARPDHLAAVAVGDFDADGKDDLAMGMGDYDVPLNAGGAVVIEYGPVATSGIATVVGDATLPGAVERGYAGYAVAAADHDGDGAADLVIGAPGQHAVHLVYGGARGDVPTSLAATGSVASITDGGDFFGYLLAAGGDMDGDGTDEIALADYRYGTTVDRACLLYGSPSRRTGSTAIGAACVTLLGAADDYFGSALALVGDMDGDGLAELVVGADRDDTAGTDAGASYLFLGASTPLSGYVAETTADLVYLGSEPGYLAAYRVFALADVTGDGYADAGVNNAGYGMDCTGSCGSLSVLAGGSTLAPTAIATLTGSNLFQGFAGAAGPVGDQDGDGTDDMLIGASSADSAVGAATLFYGPPSGVMPAVTADVTFWGQTGTEGWFGSHVAPRVADLTGDGVPDLVVGAYAEDSVAEEAGAVYLWAGFGGE